MRGDDDDDDDDDDDERRASSGVRITLHRFTSELPAVASTPTTGGALPDSSMSPSLSTNMADDDAVAAVWREHERMGPFAPASFWHCGLTI
jgi:hypothetical protein